MPALRHFKDLRVRALRVARFGCPGCGPSLLVRYGDDETQVRCLRCSGTPVHLSLIDCLVRHADDLGRRDAYELSGSGPLPGFLRRHCRSVVTSEYLDAAAPGSLNGGVRCEDVQRLSFDDASFDLCTSTEVFEHVPDDLAGFRELHRVLRPGGLCLFTVPLTGLAVTVERARLVDGRVEHQLPPAYHGDRLRGPGRVLVYRDYGTDICDRLLESGFVQAWLHEPAQAFFGHVRKVVVATR